MTAKDSVAKALGANAITAGGQEITFWGLFAQSVILQAIMALVLLVTIVVMVLREDPVPDILAWGFSLILGFYFGSKKVQAQK